MVPHELGKQKGILIYSGITGTFYFRKYTKGGEFVDYKILHHDLSITINDSDAFVYKNKDGELYIDHAPYKDEHGNPL